MHSFAQSTVLLAHPGNQPLHVHREFRSDASPQTEQENRLGRIRGVGCGCVGVAAAGRQYTLSDGPINNSRWADQCPAENALIQQEYSELDEADAYKTPRYVSLSISRPVPAAVCAVGVHARY